MASHVRHVTVDRTDAYRLGTFWAEALNAPLSDDDRPGDPEALVEYPGAALLFVAVPDPRTKSLKNRLRLDLQPQDRTRDEEVERLLALGATLVGGERTASMVLIDSDVIGLRNGAGALGCDCRGLSPTRSVGPRR